MANEFDERETGLRAPPGLSAAGKVWWWFHFLILVKIARLRFLAILLVIGLVIVKWDTLIKYYERWTYAGAHDHAAAGDVEWFCPMHPAIVRDTPKDKCPICFMPLSKRKKDDSAPEPLPPGIVSRVQLSPYRVVLAGVQTWTVAPVALRKEISTVGFVEFDEREMKHVAARVKGRIDKLYVSETGRMVYAGDDLAGLFSPELQVTVQTLLDAHRAKNTELLKISRDRLLLWGISEDQLAEILKTGKTNAPLRIRSPITGHVLRKFVKEGQYVDEGSPLYDVVDLSTVWIQAQVYEDDMIYLPTHKQIEEGRETVQAIAATRAYPNEKFEGRLAFIYPHVDLETRSVVVRFELDNADHKLRPGTSVSVKIHIPPAQLPVIRDAWARTRQRDALARAAAHAITGNSFGLAVADALPAADELVRMARGEALAVPEAAVIDTGAQRLVYREILPGEYEGVLVQLGPKLLGPNDVIYYPILGGLSAGDRVVTAGSFLIDAETRLNPAAGSIYIGGSSGGKTTPSAVRPSTPDENDSKIRAALAKLNEKDRRLALEQQFCPVLSHIRLGAMGVPLKLDVAGQPVFICCASCKDKAVDHPQETLAQVAKLKQGQAETANEETRIAAALAKLDAKDRKLAVAQRYCATQGERSRLGSMGTPVKLTIQGETVFLCCESCRDEARANPERSVERVKQWRAKHNQK